MAQSRRKTRVGTVISNKMDKTVVVKVETLRHHPLYRKTIKVAARFKAHDENKACGMGDLVRIEETRPLSKEKRWRVAEIIRKKEVALATPQELEEEPRSEEQKSDDTTVHQTESSG